MSDYHSYLNSIRWHGVRADMLELAGNCCEFCGSEDPPLDVHHLNYERLGKEDAADLIVLCRGCHTDAHEFPERLEQIRSFAARRTAGRTAEIVERLEALRFG